MISVTGALTATAPVRRPTTPRTLSRGCRIRTSSPPWRRCQQPPFALQVCYYAEVPGMNRRTFVDGNVFRRWPIARS